MAPPPTHSRILEINLISAEDLAPVSKNMKTYAVAWVQPDHKLATGIDQTGRTDPSWNEKFMFRLDDKFLNSEDAAIVVEIYAAAWVKDVLIGYVNVLIKDIFHLRSIADAKINYSATRTVTLQIRRPSGRPQGILNMEVILLDSTTPSVPELGDPKPKTTSKNEESFENNNELESHKSSPNAKISRSQSDVTDSTMEDNLEKRPQMGSIVNDGSGSEAKGYGSMVNGGSICSSDVGPSASIVAAAIAKGLYKPPIQHQAQTKETGLIREWTRKREESLDKKLEKWRSEMSQPASARKQKAKSSKGRRSRGNRGDDAKLFSCFGNAFGCEISITCGGSKKKHGNGNNKICHLSSVDDNYSQSFV
ncbi:hypothetical protein QUC31_009787 [Theobroma cacao]|uniref:Uncharacterized protein LOC18600039 n=1 Tax=Theobroma cacao TaxID=3641 RepID=A0AB32V624_THECC|nr:PREDICTED: uncharacterized protein LOC18600039 [Theobroma cacao]